MIAIAAVLLTLPGCITSGPLPDQQASAQPPPTPEQIQLQVAQKKAVGIQTVGVAMQQLSTVGVLVAFVFPVRSPNDLVFYKGTSSRISS